MFRAISDAMGKWECHADPKIEAPKGEVSVSIAKRNVLLAVTLHHFCVEIL